jgi:hypothetical protein
MITLSQRPVPARPLRLSTLARRTTLGLTALLGLMLVMATEFHSMMTGQPHSLTILWFGVSLIVGSAVLGAIFAILLRPERLA